jgi:hypothetical protein
MRGIVPPDPPPVRRAIPVAYREPLSRFYRGLLLVMAAGLTVVFGIAVWLKPYDDNGDRRVMATHTQLGLPECSMVKLTGRPCPSCGMTTSFALLAHGDVVGSLKANWVGTLLAVFWAALIPWGAWSAVRGRLVGVRNGELFATLAVGFFLTLLLARWGYVYFFG